MVRLSRVIRIASLLLSRAIWALATCVLVLWAIGRLASDRWLATQYLSWTPTEYVLGIGVALLVIAWFVKGRWRERATQPKRRGWRRLRSVHALPITLALFAAIGVVREHHVGSFRLVPLVQPDLRILFWNASNQVLEFPPTLVSEQHPDLAIIANPRWPMGREMLYTMVHEPSRDGERGAVLWRHGFAIASRFEILRSGSTSLGLQGVRDGMDLERDGNAAFDAGAAVFLELDTIELVGQATIVWILDLPSDPALHRAKVVRKAVEAIDAWRGPDGSLGFPRPDIVVGDLNIPAGAFSLTQIAPGTRDAHGQRGTGSGRTWPRERPLWRIDHVRLRPPWFAAESRVVDPGYANHRMIVVDLARQR